jgi:hypothetical protein
MTFEQVYDYAKNRGKSVSIDEFDSWLEIAHTDGSEFYFECCFFEFIESKDNDNAWLLLWSQNHGFIIYPENDLISWEGGEICDVEDDSVFLPS